MDRTLGRATLNSCVIEPLLRSSRLLPVCVSASLLLVYPPVHLVLPSHSVVSPGIEIVVVSLFSSSPLFFADVVFPPLVGLVIGVVFVVVP